MYASSTNVNIPKPPICVASNMCASSRNVIIPPPPHPPTPPHPDNLTIRKRKNNLNNFLTKSARNPHEMHFLKIWWFFLSQICDENLRVCMSVKRTLKVYEILQIAMNPARAFVTHICKTLKNGTGFQATCIYIYIYNYTYIYTLIYDTLHTFHGTVGRTSVSSTTSRHRLPTNLGWFHNCSPTWVKIAINMTLGKVSSGLSHSSKKKILLADGIPWKGIDHQPDVECKNLSQRTLFLTKGSILW